MPTQAAAHAWLAQARNAPLNAHHQQQIQVLLKYAMAILVATPLRDAPTRLARNPAQTESPLKSILREFLLSDSPLVSTSDVATAFGVQFGARALDASIADSLARFAQNPHAHSSQQVSSALDLVLVLFKNHLSSNLISR